MFQAFMAFFEFIICESVNVHVEQIKNECFIHILKRYFLLYTTVLYFLYVSFSRHLFNGTIYTAFRDIFLFMY